MEHIIDIYKITSGLRHCTHYINSVPKDKNYCTHYGTLCPYFEDYNCKHTLEKDALKFFEELIGQKD